jgi:SAM-dependent methyltransferase
MPSTPKSEERKFLPALRFSWLTPVFDPVARVTARERALKRRLLERAAVRSGERVLDVGGGTGTLAIMLALNVPDANVTCLDADPAILAQARRKAAEAGVDIDCVEGFSSSLPFPDGHFDVALSSLFFHHLERDVKEQTFAELARVVKPGGRLHVGDWGKPSDPVMAVAVLQVRAFDGFDVTADNVSGALPGMIERAGFESVHVSGKMRTPLGTIAFYDARRPVADAQ